MPDYISIYQSGQKVDELLGKAETALQQSNLDAFKKTIADTYSTKKELETTKTELTTSIDTKINEGVNAKLNISTYNSDNEKLSAFGNEVNSEIEALKKKDEELQAEINKKVSTDTYNGANELLSNWATEIQLEIETINGRFKKKTITGGKTNSGGAYNTGLDMTTAIYLGASTTVKSLGPTGKENEPLFFVPVLSGGNLTTIFLYTFEVWHTEKDGHHDVVLCPSRDLGTLTIYYYDLTDLEYGAAPASISDDDIFDEEFPV